MLKSVATAVTRFVNEVLFPPCPEVSHEHARLAERVGDPERWEQICAARGLSGLTLGAARAWEYGVVLRFHLLT
ncbi:hypothetical protein, partial [Streptomyces griseorubiginosus]|uniref:hypothetical protein n=1 Tax=Streptomyces griseorubiginosus TaxID=67304 RepID=UPI000AC4BBBD